MMKKRGKTINSDFWGKKMGREKTKKNDIEKINSKIYIIKFKIKKINNFI